VSRKFQAWIAAGASAAFAAGGVASAGAAETDELLVTAERRPAAPQEAPVALSAFSAKDLRVSRLDGARDLLRASPNTNYSRSNFGGYNLSIRGIGSKIIGLSGEYGVSVHVNDTPFTVSRLPDSDFYDVERVELLRGPQGTLYGRNATGGSLNILTARPTDKAGGWITGEYGDYDSVRLSGAVNLPVNDMLAVRFAGFLLDRDGFAKNTFDGHRIDDRDIKASRLTARLHPSDAFDLNVMWERFDEKDHRLRVGKPLCINDPGPTAIGAVPVGPANRSYLSQGCLPGSRYQAAAYGVVNSQATLPGLYLPLTGLARGDLFAGQSQSQNLRDVSSPFDPRYQVRTDFYQIDAKAKLGPALTLNSLTGVSYDRATSFQDYMRVAPQGTFASTGLFPGGVVNDPQLGSANTLRAYDYFATHTKEFTQELRLTSDFGGAWNFSLGGLHRTYDASSRYFVMANGLTAFAQAADAGAGFPNTFPFFVDPGFPPSGEGRSYFANVATNRARSDAVFGEAYWRPQPDLRLTLGLRATRDRKESEPNPVSLLTTAFTPATPPDSGLRLNPMFTGGRGLVAAPLLKRSDTATTGRLNVEWSPKLGFTDRTMVYANYARGYKAGGFNTPCDIQSPGCGSVPADFGPETIDAYEVGTKNILAGGRLMLNLTAFLYDYRGYQVSSIVNKSSITQNIDARLHGAELESVWEPRRGLRFNVGAGWLRTRIREGQVIDTLDRTQGDPRLAIVKAQDGSNCVVNRGGLAQLVAIQEALPGAPNLPGVTGQPAALLAACSGVYSALGLYNYAGTGVVTAPVVVNNAPRPNTVAQVGQGVPVVLRGNHLPNAPEWTLALGAQYGWEIGGWNALLRGDYYRQGDSFARIFNGASDRLRGYGVLNATFTLARPGGGLEVQLFGKNLTHAEPITDFYVADDSAGLFTNASTLEPRTWGVAVTRRF